jgi:hypothetical protein
LIQTNPLSARLVTKPMNGEFRNSQPIKIKEKIFSSISGALRIMELVQVLGELVTPSVILTQRVGIWALRLSPQRYYIATG